MTATEKNIQSGCKTKISGTVRGFSCQNLGIVLGNNTGESSEKSRE